VGSLILQTGNSKLQTGIKFFDILEEVIEKKRRQQIGSCLALKDYKDKSEQVVILMHG